MNRVRLYDALFAKLQTVQGFTTISRRLKHWQDVPQDQQPSLHMLQVSENAQTASGQPTKWLLRVDIYIYVRTPDETQAPAELLNPLLDAVTEVINALHPMTGRADLGEGNDAYCRIDGSIETDEGVLGNQAVAIIPITIFAT